MIRSAPFKEIRDGTGSEVFPGFRKTVNSIQIFFVTFNRSSIFVIFVNGYSLTQTVDFREWRI